MIGKSRQFMTIRNHNTEGTYEKPCNSCAKNGCPHGNGHGAIRVASRSICATSYTAANRRIRFPTGAILCSKWPEWRCLYVPPDKNSVGWTNDQEPVLFGLVDYAGLATNAYPIGHQPTITETITERHYGDGLTETTVWLYTKNANVWVIELDFTTGLDPYFQIATNTTIFGHRPADVGSGQHLGIRYCIWSLFKKPDCPCLT